MGSHFPWSLRGECFVFLPKISRSGNLGGYSAFIFFYPWRENLDYMDYLSFFRVVISFIPGSSIFLVDLGRNVLGRGKLIVNI